MWKNNTLFPTAEQQELSCSNSSFRQQSHAKHEDVFLLTPTKFMRRTGSKENILYSPEQKLTLDADTEF